MFKPVSCVQTNVQPGFRRFSDSHGQPLIKAWRCELTALSHAFNIYFVACNETIHIYQPSFPNQSLPEEADLVLHPPISSPLLEPGIDFTDPHSITRLHVDYLGREEILLVTCDDGDVVGYRVSEIHRAIESRRDSPDDETEIDLEDQIRVFLHRNVGASAWGLAVHREARLIAISANTHLVTVLAYALSSPEDKEIDYEGLDGFSSDESDEDFPHPRKRDHVITLQAQTNIPAVSFDNNGGDPSGRWLFSSSIDGVNHLWDLYHPQMPARLFELGHCASVEDPATVPRLCMCPNRTSVPHAAWAAMFVDPRSCHQTTSLSEACGPGFGAEGPVRHPPCFWDITETKSRFSTRRSGPFPSSWNPAPVPIEDAGSESSGMSLSQAEEEGENDVEQSETHGSEQMSTDTDDESEVQHGSDSNEGDGQEQPQNQQLPPSSQLLNDEPPAYYVHTLEHPIHLMDDEESLFVPQEPPPPAPGPSAPAHVAMLTQWLQGDMEDDDSGSEDLSPLSETADELVQLIQAETATILPPAPEPARAPPKKPYCEVSTSEDFQNRSKSPRPCVIVTKEEIYLFQRPFDPAGDLSDPILTMRNPLFPPDDDLLGRTFPAPAYHRHCFSTQIPELGIFIVATPAGRVGIFSLTKVGTEDHEQPLYGFRMDHLLPSTQRDGKHIIEEVWGRRLMGVAVGPVQGMLDQPEDEDGKVEERELGARRWRLMMYYHDHTVYSYELGKYTEDESPGLGDLVV